MYFYRHGQQMWTWPRVDQHWTSFHGDIVMRNIHIPQLNLSSVE